MGKDAPETTSKTETTVERAIVCKECRHALTRENERIDVDGRHQHTFVNPHAYAFTIACFRHAPGCVSEGEGETFWSWFEGHVWRIAECGECRAHVGWSFEGRSAFFGLIVDRIAT